MTGERFPREALDQLKAQFAREPGMPVEDAVRCISQAVEHILKKDAGALRLLITLDGPCASGKTTLARKLAQALQGQVAHTDDYVIPHALKTPDRLAVPGGNCDAQRLVKEIVAPFKNSDPVRYFFALPGGGEGVSIYFIPFPFQKATFPGAAPHFSAVFFGRWGGKKTAVFFCSPGGIYLGGFFSNSF